MGEVILALMPILLLFLLMVVFKVSAIKAMPLAWGSGILVLNIKGEAPEGIKNS